MEKMKSKEGLYSHVSLLKGFRNATCTSMVCHNFPLIALLSELHLQWL